MMTIDNINIISQRFHRLLLDLPSLHWVPISAYRSPKSSKIIHQEFGLTLAVHKIPPLTSERRCPQSKYPTAGSLYFTSTI